MKKMKKKRAGLRIPVASILAAASAVLLFPRGSAGGDMAEKYLKSAPVLSPGRTTAGGNGALSNKFEISSYELEKPGGEQASVTYTRQLLNALKKREGWVSEVLPSDEEYFKTGKDCEAKKTFCDVVGVTETTADDKMILTLDVDSFPKSHSELHKTRFASEPHKCNPHNCSEKGCRAQLIEEIVEELVALDKDHKGSR